MFKSKMIKKKIKTLFATFSIIILIVGLILGSLYFFGQSVFLEDEVILGDGLSVDTGVECVNKDSYLCNIEVVKASKSTPTWELKGDVSGTEDEIILGRVYKAPGTNEPYMSSGTAKTAIDLSDRLLRFNLIYYNAQTICPAGTNQRNPCEPDIYTVKINDQIVIKETIGRGTTTGGLLEIIPDIIKRDNYEVWYKGEKKADLINDQIYVEFQGAGLTIRNSRYKTRFSCEIENDEIVVFDEFSNNFNIGSLGYTPEKFCLESYPATVRSLSEQGVEPDRRASITRSLASGETISVNPGEIVRITYITDFEEGMGEQCDYLSGFALNTKTGECVKYIEEAEDIIVITNNVTTVFSDPESLNLGAASRIDNQVIEVTDVKFVCDKTQNYNAPKPSEDCWRISFTTPHGDFSNVIHGTQTQAGKYYSITPIATGEWESDCENCPEGCDYSINSSHDGIERTKGIGEGCVKGGKADLYFKITDYSFFESTPVEQSSYSVKLNSENQMCFNLKNNLDLSFSDLQSGFLVTQTRDLVFSQKRYEENIGITTGSNIVCLPINTGVLGWVYYDIVPFFRIGNLGGTKYRVLDNEKAVLSFFINNEDLPTPDFDLPVIDKVENEIDGFKDAKPTTFWIIIVLFVLFIALIFYKIWRK